MSLSKKDYVKLAGVIQSGLDYAARGAGNFDRRYKKEAVQFIAQELAYVLAEDNPAFNKDLFFVNCGQGILQKAELKVVS